MIAAGAKYRKENREKDIARHAKYRKENAEKLKARAADYYKKNREERAVRSIPTLNRTPGSFIHKRCSPRTHRVETPAPADEASNQTTRKLK
jgi:hypothetical protein